MSEDQAKTSDLQFLTEAIIIQDALQWYHDFLTQKMGPYKISDYADMMRLHEMRICDSWQLLNGASDRLYNGGLLFAIDEHELFRLIFDNGLFMAVNGALEAKNVTLERFVYELRDKGLLQKDDPDFITNEEAEYRLNCDVRRWLWAMRNKNQPTSKAADQQQAAAPAADRKQKERKGRQGRLFKFIGEMKQEHRIVFLTNNSGCKDHDILFETVWFPRYNTLYPKEAIKDIKAFKAAVASAKKGYKKEYPDWMDSE